MPLPSRPVAGIRSRAWRGAASGLLLVAALVAACAGPAPSGLAASARAPAPAAVPADGGFGRLDSLVTAETVFPDSTQRALYRVLPPVTEGGRRSCAFQLLAQPGMNPMRHFQLVTVTWARGGQFVAAPGACAALSGSAGPGGSFVDACAQTVDRAWDVRVSLGTLLPNSVNVPDFDVAGAAAALVRLYKAR